MWIKQNKHAVSFKYLVHVKTVTSSKTTNLEIFPLNLFIFSRLIKTGFFHLDKIRHQNRQKNAAITGYYTKNANCAADSSPDFLCVYKAHSLSKQFCTMICFSNNDSWCRLCLLWKVWWEWYLFQTMKIVQICLLSEWILVTWYLEEDNECSFDWWVLGTFPIFL